MHLHTSPPRTKTSLSAHDESHGKIEFLEARIAPAGVTVTFQMPDSKTPNDLQLALNGFYFELTDRLSGTLISKQSALGVDQVAVLGVAYHEDDLKIVIPAQLNLHFEFDGGVGENIDNVQVVGVSDSAGPGIKSETYTARPGEASLSFTNTSGTIVDLTVRNVTQITDTAFTIVFILNTGDGNDLVTLSNAAPNGLLQAGINLGKSVPIDFANKLTAMVRTEGGSDHVSVRISQRPLGIQELDVDVGTGKNRVSVLSSSVNLGIFGFDADETNVDVSGFDALTNPLRLLPKEHSLNLTINDSGSAKARSLTLSGDGLLRTFNSQDVFPGIYFNYRLTSINLIFGTGNDNLQLTGANAGTKSLFVDLGPGNDILTIPVINSWPETKIEVRGGLNNTGIDLLRLNPDYHWLEETNGTFFLGQSTVKYSGFESISILNQAPRITVSSWHASEGTLGAQSVFFDVQLAFPVARALTFSATFDGTATFGSDYIPDWNATTSFSTSQAGGNALPRITITVPAGSSHVLIPVTIFGDEITEANESIQLSLSSDLGIPSATGTGSILNDDHIVAVSTGGHGKQLVRVMNPSTGNELYDFVPFSAKTRGAVRLAIGDVNGDGADDIIVATSHGRGLVRVFDGLTGTPWDYGFPIYASKWNGNGGAYVAAGDIDGNGMDDIIVGSGAGKSRISVFSEGSPIAIPEAISSPFGNLAHGVTVACGDVDGDGHVEIIAAPASGARPIVRIFNPVSGQILDFLAFRRDYHGGLSLAAGDLDGDGRSEIVIGQGAGGAGWVRTFSWIEQKFTMRAQPFGDYKAAVSVAVADLNGDGKLDILTAANAKDESQVQYLRGDTLETFRHLDLFRPHPNLEFQVAALSRIVRQQ